MIEPRSYNLNKHQALHRFSLSIILVLTSTAAHTIYFLYISMIVVEQFQRQKKRMREVKKERKKKH